MSNTPAISPYSCVWHTPGGKAAKRHLETWGDVQRERFVTGDPTAIPAPYGERIAGPRRSSFCIPDAALVSAEVDQQIAKGRFTGPGLRLLLLAIYRDGCTFVEQGSELHRVWIYNLDEFKDDTLDAVARCFGWTRHERRQHLELTHQMFAYRLARDKGLGTLTIPVPGAIE